MAENLRVLHTYELPNVHAPGLTRTFEIVSIDGLHDTAHEFIESNGGADFIHRIVQAAQPIRGKSPTMRRHSKTAAIKIPLHVVKPGTTRTPRHVDNQNVHVSFESSNDRFNDRGQNLVENMLDLHRFWERMKVLGLLRIRQMRTSVPLFAVRESNVPENRPAAKYMVSIQSTLPTLEERLQQLGDPGQLGEKKELAKRFQNYLYTLEHEYGIKPGTTGTGDYFVHHPKGKGKTPDFLLILPRGGRLLPLPKKWHGKLESVLRKNELESRKDDKDPTKKVLDPHIVSLAKEELKRAA